MAQLLSLMVLIVFLSALSADYLASGQEIKTTFAVFHALETSGGPAEPIWSARAKVSVNQLIGSGQHASLEENALTEEDRRAFSQLQQQDGLYRIKVVDTATGQYVQSYIKATLTDPEKYILKLSVDSSGFLESASFILPSNHEAKQGRVVVDVLQNAPQPDTQTYIVRMERDRKEKEKSAHQDNRSFLAKYWMYILPVVIFVLMSGASNPEGGAR